jgi:hypothetical protein
MLRHVLTPHSTNVEDTAKLKNYVRKYQPLDSDQKPSA